MSDELQAAFVLHRRNYRDTSQIIELFTATNGRISVIAKGAKRNKSPLKNCLQMFQPLLVNYKGKHELLTLIHAELEQTYSAIAGQYLAWAFYVNELLYRLLQKHDPYPYLFQHYKNIIHKMTTKTITEADLRYFEYELLHRLGYGVHISEDSMHQALDKDAFYILQPMQTPIKTQLTETSKQIYKGDSLIALEQKNLSTPAHLQDAKRLLRQALHELLGDKPLKSRELLL